MSIDQIGAEALKLPLWERALLAGSLRESIEDPYELLIGRDDEEAIELALKRDAELESGAVKALSHEELMSRLPG